MKYAEIIDLALKYADRQDNEVIERMDLFLRIVESRINRALQVQKQAIRTILHTKTDQEYYGLPADFAGLRDVEIRPLTEPNKRTTLAYFAPEKMNELAGIDDSEVRYTIVADQIHIVPPQTQKVLEIVYYRNVPPLTADKDHLENWVSVYNPDLYLFGLMVEINAFTKDANTTQLWDMRFREVLKEIDKDDSKTRWSGTPLQIRMG